MNTVTLRGHFDGEQIRLCDQYVLEPNTDLIITVLPREAADSDHDAWVHLAALGLAGAYGEDEPEYPLSMIKEWNPEYDPHF